MSNDSISYFDTNEYDKENNIHTTIKIFESLKATSILVGILKHYGELNVPKEIFMELLTEEQIFPNVFITKNGSAMCVTYNENSDEFGFADEDGAHHNQRIFFSFHLFQI
jgi:hypothetical protein